ncbi:hypothetical protein DW715_03965 [Bacteroides intestinalis]|nr:hypothetical protein DW715_03965 [Bacteroides intestinalis]
MKAKRAYYHRNIGSLNKGAKIELLKVIVSYVLNTVIPVFYLIVWLLRPYFLERYIGGITRII